MTNAPNGPVARDEHADDPDARADELVEEIEQTRDEMSETVQAIGEKLDPGNIAREAGETVKSATVGKVEQMAMGAQETWRDVSRGDTSGIMDTITSNPVPAGMVAVGVAMLLMSRGAASRQRFADRGYGNGGYGNGGYGNGGYGSGDRYEPEYRSTADSWRRSGGARPSSGGSTPLDSVGSAVSGFADQAGSTVGQAADEAGRRVGEVADQFGQSAMQAQTEAERLLRRGSSQVRRLFDENPLAVGAVALAAGAAAGALLPTTEPERRMIGPARDRVVGEAEAAAHEALDEVEEQVASEHDGGMAPSM